MAADLLAGVGDEVKILRHGGLQLVAVHQRRLNVSAHAALRRLGGGQQLAHKAVRLKRPDVAVGDGADAEHGNVLLADQRVKGHVGGDGELAAHVVAVDVGGGVGLGVAQLLRLLQNGGEGHRRGVHGVHDEVGGAVHDAADLADGVQPLAPLQIGQPRNAAAHRRRAAQGHAVFRRQPYKLRVKRADDRFVGGDHMLAAAQRLTDVFVGRMQPAHDLNDDADAGVADDGADVRHRPIAQLRPLPPHQHFRDVQIRPLGAKVHNAAAYYAAAQQSDIHTKTSHGAKFVAPILSESRTNVNR